MLACLNDSSWPWVLLIKEGGSRISFNCVQQGPIIFGEKILEGVRRGL